MLLLAPRIAFAGCPCCGCSARHGVLCGAMLIVSSLEHAPSQVAAHRPLRSLSLLSPGHAEGFDASWLPAERVILRFHDVVEPGPDHVVADEAMVRAILAFGRRCAPKQPALVHCWMGVSRSPAAAFVIACARAPGDERAVARELRRRAPHATPNRLLVAVADDVLGCHGRMVDAVTAIGRGQEVEGAVEPFSLPLSW